MPDDFTIHGAEQFLRLSKALKAAGRTEIRKELNKRLQVAAKPLIAKTRSSARQKLPAHGGLAERVARAPQRVQVRTGGDPGVRIVVGKDKSGARGANEGKVRHPVFGNREVFVDQTVEPGWFDEPLEAAAPEVRPHLEQALETIAERVVREAG